jgi:hypothetical protein
VFGAEADLNADTNTPAVQALAERIAALALSRLDELVALTTRLLDDESYTLGAKEKLALAAYASRFFEGFEDDVATEILDQTRVSRSRSPRARRTSTSARTPGQADREEARPWRA